MFFCKNTYTYAYISFSYIFTPFRVYLSLIMLLLDLDSHTNLSLVIFERTRKIEKKKNLEEDVELDLFPTFP